MLKVIIFVLPLLVACATPPSDIIKQPTGVAVIDLGRHLTRGVAHCGFCHAGPQSLSGGKVIRDTYGDVNVPNITPAQSGIYGWSVPQVVAALRQSKGSQDRKLSPESHRGYEWMSDNDAIAIGAYLRSLQPVENTVERRDVDFWERNTVGFFTKSKEVPGSVPVVSQQDKVGFGKYLVNHVARCSECHSSAVSILGDTQYLAGGKPFSVNGKETVAPALFPGAANEWSTGETVQYLRTGRTPDGRDIDKDFCPVSFYARADEDELLSIAAYLRSVGDSGR